jgi:hypothetical protein
VLDESTYHEDQTVLVYQQFLTCFSSTVSKLAGWLSRTLSFKPRIILTRQSRQAFNLQVSHGTCICYEAWLSTPTRVTAKLRQLSIRFLSSPAPSPRKS